MKLVVMKKRSPELPGNKGRSTLERKKKGNPEYSQVVSEQGEVQQALPREYQDLMEVFSEKECDMLPLHHLTDCH